ncbi:MAG: DUF2905 domain-containing protein [bacterium]|nr:DUF2905 domain-containing protein [bacterium]
MANLFIIIGFTLLLLGLLSSFSLSGMLPRLPGDILIQRENFTLYVPLATSIVISLALTFLVNLFLR